MSRFSFLAVALVALLALLPAGASAAENYFDPARHMKLSEVRPGMTGYGLSVFQGTKIERFGVEVISILRDFNPKYDVILVRLNGANLEHTGSIAGMSGSPIYLKDDQGRERMVGAFAYGWTLMKDPVGGVQPIEYMLSISGPRSRANPNVAPTTAPATTAPLTGVGVAAPRTTPLHWDVREAVMLPGMKQPPASWPFDGVNTTRPNPRLAGAVGLGDAGDVTRLRPLATPLMTAGLPPKLVEQLTPVFNAYGLMPLQSGGVAAGRAGEGSDAKLEPGSAMAVPLLTGDLEMTAIGTCTEVIGDRVWGFGHPFQNEGPVSLPVAGGEINGVIANLMTSFKLGALGKVYGTLYADEQVGVAGKLGEAPPMVPINLKVHYTDGDPNDPSLGPRPADREYSFTSAWHPRFTPLLAATALTASVTGAHDLPEFHTIDYDATIEFENGRKIKVANSLVNVSMAELFFEFGTPMIVAAQNPFERVGVRSIEGTVHISPHARDSRLLWVNAPRLKFRPGETLKAFVHYRTFRAGDDTLPIEFELPRDLPEGTYQLTVSGWEQYLQDEQTARPFRFSAESSKDVFNVIQELLSIRHNAIYLRLLRQPDGIAIGRTAMPNLPSSRREVLLGAGRSNTTPFVSSTTRIIPTKDLIAGVAQFEVTIDKDARVETGGGRSTPRGEPPAAAPPGPARPTLETPRVPTNPEVPVVPTPPPAEPAPTDDPGAVD